ncbi:hypothetical protein [Nesterenkonia populi]|uniref:hypothetical protein n=1 Tax=Nesterenkonia populi TaxID=1591087 RepID=UPI0011BF42B4|nr:hypothetical protein [Nesterenkonia populi]
MAKTAAELKAARNELNRKIKAAERAEKCKQEEAFDKAYLALGKAVAEQQEATTPEAVTRLATQLAKRSQPTQQSPQPKVEAQRETGARHEQR